MYRLRFLLSVAVTLFFLLALCSIAQAAPRTFVSGLGSDANPCARTTPCRTFQKAHDTVDANGEVLALDSAGYGTLTITKNVTISGEGVEATVNALSGDAITIATAGLKVVLRSITVEGFGTGDIGMNISGAVNLTIQHCVIHGFTSDGLDFEVTSGTGNLSLSDSRITDCGGSGIDLSGTGGGTIKATISNTRGEDDVTGLQVRGAKVTIRNSAISGNSFAGISVGSTSEVNVESCESSNNNGIAIATLDATAVVRVSRSVVTDNASFGFYNAAGTFETYSFENSTNTNLLKGNNGGGAQTSGTITMVAY